MAKLTMESEKTVPLERALELAGFGWFNVIILLTSGGILLSVIVESMCMMFIIPIAQCDLNLTLTSKGLLSSISFCGIVLSSYFWGYLADTRGRRKALMLSLGVSSLTTLISAFAPWAWFMIVLRLINGMFIAGASSTVYAYSGEFQDDRYRPKVISWVCTSVALGNIYLPGIAWLILEGGWNYDLGLIAFRPWRLLLILYALPSALCVLALYFLPETPKFLLTQQKHDEVLVILRKMYKVNNSRPETEYKVNGILWENLDDGKKSEGEGIFASMWRQTVPLIRKNLLTKTLLLCFLQFAVFASTSGITMWYPEILNRMSNFMQDYPHADVSLCGAILYEDLDTNENIISCKDSLKTDVFSVTMIIAAAYACAYIFIGFVINSIGKKTLMAGFSGTTAIAGICAQFVYGYIPIQVLIGLYLMGGVGIGIVNAIAVDVFPTQVRAMAMALSLMCGRIGAMVASNIVGPIIFNLCDYLFIILACLNFCIIITLILLPRQSKMPKLIHE